MKNSRSLHVSTHAPSAQLRSKHQHEVWQVAQTAEPLFIRSMPQRMGAYGLPAVLPRWPLEVCTP